MYNQLATIYDSLVKDDQATQDWVAFVLRHADANSYLEVACGSGEITIALANKGKHIDASDISEQMLEKAKEKTSSNFIHFSHQDLRNLNTEKKYDVVLCLCDSLNYVLEDKEIQGFFQTSYDSLEVKGTLIFDVHSIDRIEEFKDEFLEEGHLDGYDYEWSIESHGDMIYQNFLFFDEEGKTTHEQHVQRVYDPTVLEQWLVNVGFTIDVYTDFTQEGIQAGEKYFFVCKKG